MYLALTGHSMIKRLIQPGLLLALMAGLRPSVAAELPRNEQAIADVEAGRVDTARALWWGFSEQDATKALQDAINSRARRVVIDNPGGPWIVTPLQLSGDKEIIFENGVVIEAKRDAFQGKGDCLFTALGQKHLILRGDGATLRMHKEDYHRAPYEPAEWRHALSLRGCEDILIEGLTLIDSGGDGIYLGTGADRAANVAVTIRRVTCDGNNRQGISIITAENLTIEDCVFRNTSGTAPQAGIDFEPNSPQEELVNCLVRNCRSESNAGCGYLVYLGNMSRESTPVSIRFENCTSQGCRDPSVYLSMAHRDGLHGVTGTIEFVQCRFDGDTAGGVVVRGNQADGALLRWERCEIIRHDPGNTRAAPIMIESPGGSDAQTGNIEFRDCLVRDSLVRNPIVLIASPLSGLPKIVGSLRCISPMGERLYVLTPQQLAEWFPEQGVLSGIAPYDFRWQQAQLVAAEQVPAGDGQSVESADMTVRGEAEFLMWATAGAEVQCECQVGAVVAAKPIQSIMTVSDCDGETLVLDPVQQSDHLAYRFTPTITGVHQLQWRGNSNTTLRLNCSHPWAWVSTARGLHLFRSTGTLYCVVPAGIERFAILLSGEGTEETVRATVRTASDEVAAEEDVIGLTHPFVLQREAGDTTEIWSLVLEKASTGVLEDVTIHVVGIPPTLTTSRSRVFTVPVDTP